MADEETDGTLGAAEPEGKPESPPSPAGAGTEAGEFYVSTYRSREEAERGLAEKEAEVRRAHSERDRLQAMVEKVLAQPAPSSTPQKPDPRKQEEELERLREELRTDSGKGIDITAQWLADVEKQGREYADARYKEAATKLEALQERVVRASPEYQRNKEFIETLRGKGVGLDDAMELAATLVKPAGPRQPERPAPPGRTGGDKGGAGDEPATSPEEEAFLQGWLGKLSDADKDVLKRRRAAK